MENLAISKGICQKPFNMKSTQKQKNKEVKVAPYKPTQGPLLTTIATSGGLQWVFDTGPEGPELEG